MSADCPGGKRPHTVMVSGGWPDHVNSVRWTEARKLIIWINYQLTAGYAWADFAEQLQHSLQTVSEITNCRNNRRDVKMYNNLIQDITLY